MSLGRVGFWLKLIKEGLPYRLMSLPIVMKLFTLAFLLELFL